MLEDPFIYSSHITRYQKRGRITTWSIKNTFYPLFI
jgi:hypothetical protein